MVNNPLASLDELLGDEEMSGAAQDISDFLSSAFPPIYAKHGGALEIRNTGIARISEDFFAELFGNLGNPQLPVVFIPEENRFFQYCPSSGIYSAVETQELHAQLAATLRRVARESKLPQNIADSFGLRFGNTPTARNVVERAKALLARPSFFRRDIGFIAVENGLLNLDDLALVPFSPERPVRSKLAVKFDPAAKCPRFLETLLRPMMTLDDLDVLQKWCGQAVVGINVAQVILLVIGAAGSGKSAFCAVLSQIVGSRNISTLRPNLLTNRFELARLIDRRLILGSDVNTKFLETDAASMIKGLTGGDLFTVELKGSHAQPEIHGVYNILLTSNAAPTIRLDHDADAWQRRLLVLPVKKSPGMVPQHDLAEDLFVTEGSGILNWMLDGWRKLKKANFRFQLTAVQQEIVAQVLGNSQSVLHFVDAHLVEDESASITAKELYERYVQFCRMKQWNPRGRVDFSTEAKDLIDAKYGVSLRNDVADSAGRSNRGWVGVECNCPLPTDGGTFRQRRPQATGQ